MIQWKWGVVVVLLTAFCNQVSWSLIPKSLSTKDGTLSSKENNEIHIIKPNECFRDTVPGEVSIVTMNILAPTYNSLAIENWKERIDFLQEDRKHRMPLALQMAKQYNADVLCLQEVEGGNDELEAELKQLLISPSHVGNKKIQGYDTFLWTSLLPNRADHVVGNCVAWRSDRHKLVAVDCFRRGMVVKLQEVEEEGATFCAACVHLPAKPSNIYGRLKTTSNVLEKLAHYDPPVRKNPLDGLLVVAGDFNCDHNSVTAKLLTSGYSPYGNIKDRNYKVNVSKAQAYSMKHDYRFKDVYEENRENVAPVTVSLSGRGPGCMDHLFFAQNHKVKRRSPPKNQPLLAIGGKPSRKNLGKRKARRQRVTWIQSRKEIQTNMPTAVKVESILATVSGPDDHQRLDIINSGLPNVEKGFPSDHLPIGALFVPDESFQTRQKEMTETSTVDEEDNNIIDEQSATSMVEKSIKSGLSANAIRRREAGAQSMSKRKRHNVVLNCVTEWLKESYGARDIHRDCPLYKLKFAQGLQQKLKKKSRAPDLVCCLGESLVVIEVTVTSKPDSVRLSKLTKYEDLETLLQSSPVVKEAGLTVQSPFVILLDEQGGIHEETKQDLVNLIKLTGKSDDSAQIEAQRFCNHLQGIFNEL